MNKLYAMRSRRLDLISRQISRVLALKSLGLICLICIASTASAQNRYQITRIPTAQGANSAALGINNHGEVVGYSFQGEDYQAFLYSASDQSLTNVGSLGGKINAACAINDAGQVTGYSQDGNGNILAFIFSRDQSMTSLGALEGASTSEAFGINKSGAVVGDSQSGKQNHRPVLFSQKSVQDLGLGGSDEPDALETAYAINDAGQIVGRHSVGSNAYHAFVFLDGHTTDLSTLGGTNGEGLALNKNGLVVGDSERADGSPHAFVFDHSPLKDLGTLPGFDTASFARGINNSGDIVGESDSTDQKRAFLFTKGQLVELDELAGNLSAAGFNSLDVAYGINDKGWIVGYGTTSDNLNAAFIAVPEGHGGEGQTSGLPQRQVPRQEGPTQPPSEDRQEQSVSESDADDYDVFYSGLSSDEGNWVAAGDYGYCFRPRVTGDWRPYRDGHWVWTDRGWYWDSNERFGWATYHYGRWVNIDGTGWCWVPGNQWAPAWVSWRESEQHIGWAPLPPEADISARQSISSWSDSYYGIGPAAYSFIRYSHWREPNYAQYIERPERNVQIIRDTRNVTNIVNQNNVINNFGPRVQMVARRTNHPIPQVNLALNRATDPRANYGQTRQGNQLKVLAPPATLRAQARNAPPVQNRIANPQVENGWHGVTPEDAAKLKKTIAAQNPLPKNLAKPPPFVNPQIGRKDQVTPSPGATASPAAVVQQKTPPNLLKPGIRPPKSNLAPGASPSASAAGRKPIPPNLLGAKTSGTPGALPTVQPQATSSGSPVRPGGSPSTPGVPGPKQSPSGNLPGRPPNTPKEVPANLNTPRPSPTPGRPGSEGNPPTGSPTPLPTPIPLQPAKPAAPKPTSTPRQEPVKLTTPNPAPEVIATPREISPPKLTPVPKPNDQPATIPKPNPEVIATPPPKQETTTTPPPPIQRTPASQPRIVPATTPKPPAQKSTPPKPPIKTPPPQVQHTPVPQPRVAHTPAAKPPAQKVAPPKPQIKTPPPQVQRAPAAQPRVPQAPPAQKTGPPKQAQQAKPPQGGEKHAPAKGKPTPKP